MARRLCGAETGQQGLKLTRDFCAECGTKERFWCPGIRVSDIDLGNVDLLLNKVFISRQSKSTESLQSLTWSAV
jgi:hypothetical protein